MTTAGLELKPQILYTNMGAIKTWALLKSHLIVLSVKQLFTIRDKEHRTQIFRSKPML